MLEMFGYFLLWAGAMLWLMVLAGVFFFSVIAWVFKLIKRAILSTIN